jgi:DNA-binding beta-propeller fold protein YncE
MKALLVVLTGVGAMPIAAAHDESCPKGIFETEPQKIAATAAQHANESKLPARESTEYLPIEISRIRNGGISSYVGAFINDGIITWGAYDAERQLFIAVDGKAGRNVNSVPKQESLTSNQIVRYVERSGTRRADFVTIVSATPQQAREFGCLANRLLAAPSTSEQRPMPSDTAGKATYLVRDGLTVSRGGGSTRWALEDRIQQFIGEPLEELLLRAWGQWNPPYTGAVAVDGSDNLYLFMHPGMSHSKLPYMNIDIRRIAPSGLVTAFTGHVTGHAVGRYGLGDPEIAVDRAGNVLVPDSQNKFIYKVPPRGLTKVLAGSGQFGSADGPAPSVSFNQPSGIAVDPAGNVYVGDTAAIRKLVPAGEVTTLAGTHDLGHSDGSCAVASFSALMNLAADAEGNVYVAEPLTNIIRKISRNCVVTTLAGKARAYGAEDGPGNEARFSQPDGIAVDRAGNIYVADSGNHTIRRISPTGFVTTLAGKAGVPGSVDGVGDQARFARPLHIAVDSAGNIYVADVGNYLLRRVTPNGVVTTLNTDKWFGTDDPERH